VCCKCVAECCNERLDKLGAAVLRVIVERLPEVINICIRARMLQCASRQTWGRRAPGHCRATSRSYQYLHSPLSPTGRNSQKVSGKVKQIKIKNNCIPHSPLSAEILKKKGNRNKTKKSNKINTTFAAESEWQKFSRSKGK